MELTITDINKKFKFKCKKCGFCCQFTIVLYPFDIMNICSHLSITTKEFLEKYGILVPDQDGILRCVLRKNQKCLFNKDNLCTVYEARPIRCRLFPIGRYFEEGKTYYLLPKEKCIGFDSNKKQSIQEWIINQNVSEYDKMTEDWAKLMIKLKNGNYPLKDPKFMTMFTKIFYDFDNELVQKYKAKMEVKTDKEFMQLLYMIAEETLLKLK
jgi:hypothetical protein